MHLSRRGYSFAAFGFAIVALACSSYHTERSHVDDSLRLQPEAPATIQTPEPKVFTDGAVAVENVSFSFDRTLFEKVEVSEKPAEKLEADDIKPDNIGGRTLEFALNYRRSKDQASISVFKIADYQEAFARFPQYLEQRDRELKTLIKEPSTVKRWGIIEQPTHVRWMDAHHDFYAKAQIVDFHGGRGLLMLTQIGQDAYAIINNEKLEFFFQGFTDDGVYFVEMSFPADMDALPKEWSWDTAKRYNLPDEYTDPAHYALYRKYATQVAKKIDTAPDRRFHPSPRSIKAFIRSFKIN